MGENSEADEHKIWKIVPGFLRKKSRNVQQIPPEYQDVSEDNTNKAVFEEVELVISENDEGEGVIAADAIADKTAQESRVDRKEKLREVSAKRSLANRLSWTYGYKTNDHSNSTHRKKGADLGSRETSVEFPVLQLDKDDHPGSMIRTLQRGESFPGKLAAGTLSKHEARRRLMSWRRTTIVRKNSEHQ